MQTNNCISGAEELDEDSSDDENEKIQKRSIITMQETNKKAKFS